MADPPTADAPVATDPIIRSRTEDPVFRKIARRLTGFSPSIDIAEHIDSFADNKSGLRIGRSVLEGITFKPKDHDRLLRCMRNARIYGGDPAFAEGSKLDHRHWALQTSFKETKGIGFREIWRAKLSDRPLIEDRSPNSPRWDRRHSSHFGDTVTGPDLTSLHAAVAPEECNFHIDEIGFVLTGPDGKPIVDFDVLRHWAVELMLLTKLAGKYPSLVPFLDRFDPGLPSAPLDLTRIKDFVKLTPSFAILKGDTYKLSLVGSFTLVGNFEWSGTLVFKAKHDLLSKKWW